MARTSGPVFALPLDIRHQNLPVVPPRLDVPSFSGRVERNQDCLVRSTDLEYKESSVASFITSVTQAGYTQQPDGTYLKKALPKIEFKYTEVKVDETVHEIDSESVKNLPYGSMAAITNGSTSTVRD